MTFRIFLWSNLLGMPCTVVKVLRPLRSGGFQLAPNAAALPRRAETWRAGKPGKKAPGAEDFEHTLDANVDVLLGLDGLSRVLVGFGEGV